MASCTQKSLTSDSDVHCQSESSSSRGRARSNGTVTLEEKNHLQSTGAWDAMFLGCFLADANTQGRGSALPHHSRWLGTVHPGHLGGVINIEGERRVSGRANGGKLHSTTWLEILMLSEAVWARWDGCFLSRGELSPGDFQLPLGVLQEAQALNYVETGKRWRNLTLPLLHLCS